MPKENGNQVSMRNKEIDNAIKEATNIPYKTLQCCLEVINYSKEVAELGNPNSITDAGVAAELASAGAHGAALNVLINIKEINDTTFGNEMIKNTNIIFR